MHHVMLNQLHLVAQYGDQRGSCRTVEQNKRQQERKAVESLLVHNIHHPPWRPRTNLSSSSPLRPSCSSGTPAGHTTSRQKQKCNPPSPTGGVGQSESEIQSPGSLKGRIWCLRWSAMPQWNTML